MTTCKDNFRLFHQVHNCFVRTVLYSPLTVSSLFPTRSG